MMNLLEGGCRVVHVRDVNPRLHGNLRAWPLLGGGGAGAANLALRLLEFGPGSSPTCTTPQCEEVWYVLEGDATLLLSGRRHGLVPGTAVYVAPGSYLSVLNSTPDPLVVASVRSPEPGGDDILGVASSGAATPTSAKAQAPLPIVHASDRPEHLVEGRRVRVLLDAAAGSRRITQFVAAIAAGSGADLVHDDDAMLCVLEGAGTLRVGRSHAAIAPRACIGVPKGQAYRIENGGSGSLQVLAVVLSRSDPTASRAGAPSADAT